MWQYSWIGLGFFVWAFAFFKFSLGGEEMKDKVFVNLPFIVYFLCGMPKNRNVPSSVMPILFVIAQLNGLLWIFYGLVYPYLYFLSISEQIYFIGFAEFVIFAYGFKLHKSNLYKM